MRTYSRRYYLSRSPVHMTRDKKRPRAISPSSSSSPGAPSSLGASRGNQKDAKAPPAGSLSKEMVKIKKEAEGLSTRITELEMELKKTQTAKDAAQARVETLTCQVKAVAERSKNRGHMLATIVGAVRHVDDMRNQLKAAEGECERLIQSAIDLMQEEEREFQKDEQARKDTEKQLQVTVPIQSSGEKDTIDDPEAEKPMENGIEKLNIVEANEDGGNEAAGEDANVDEGLGRKRLTFKFKL